MKKIMFNDRYGLTDAVINGRKTVTRREIKTPKTFRGQDVNGFWIRPKYDFDEIVAVAQSYRDICDECFWHGAYTVRTSQLYRLAGWSNKMFTSSDEMPHQIRITDVRVERLQDISDEDCLKEGIQYIDDIDKFYFERIDREEGFYFRSPREAYAALIDKVSGKGTWDKNPYVFVYDFELIK